MLVCADSVRLSGLSDQTPGNGVPVLMQHDSAGVERHINLDPESPAGKRAREQALRLVAARIGGGRANRPDIYFNEVTAVLREVIDDPEVLVNLLNELTEVSWTLLLLVGELEDEDEGEPLDLAWLREQDSETIMAIVGNLLDRRTTKPPPDAAEGP
jgi:hypothetical protein